MVALFIHLDAANPQNGGLFVYPGSHKLGPLEDVGKLEGNFHYVDQVIFLSSNFKSGLGFSARVHSSLALMIR